MEEKDTIYDYLKANRKNEKPKGFNFDADLFEDLIENFMSKEEIATALRTDFNKLDTFCYEVYKTNFDNAYCFLKAGSDFAMKKVYRNLAKSGNNTALSITAKLMKLDEPQQANLNVTIVNDLEDNDDRR